MECRWRVWNKAIGMYWCVNPWEGKPCVGCWRISAEKIKLPSWGGGYKTFLIKRGDAKELAKIINKNKTLIDEYYYHDLSAEFKDGWLAKLFFENREKADVSVIHETAELLEGYTYFKSHRLLLYFYHFESCSGSPVTYLYQLYSLL